MKHDYGSQPKSHVGLDYLGLKNNKNVYWNLNPSQLYELALNNNEAILTNNMALRVLTGKYTGRSPQDKFIVKEPSTSKHIDWGDVNQPISEDIFDNLHEKMIEYLSDKDLFVKDVYAGADPDHRLNVRIVSQAAYHALFSDNMFIKPDKESLKRHEPEFTILAAPQFHADPKTDGTRTSTFILCNFEKKIILIGGTLYSGEVKKGIFSVLNYLLPRKNVMAMHCSANVDQDGKTSILMKKVNLKFMEQLKCRAQFLKTWCWMWTENQFLMIVHSLKIHDVHIQFTLFRMPVKPAAEIILKISYS